MAAFEYSALDERGKRRKGVLEADSSRQVRQQLRDKGWFPVDVELTQKQQSRSTGLFGGPSISIADLALVTRQLSTLVGSGMPLEECLRAVGEQSEKGRVRSLMMGVRARVLEGFSLAKALGDYPRAFPPLYRATVDAGEHSGHLDRVMIRLADYMEDQQKTRKQVQMASIYPGILTVIALLIVGFLLNSVVPEIVGVFASTGESLPGPTRVLLSVSEWVQSWWLATLLAMVGAWLALVIWNRNPTRRRMTHRLLLRLPLIGRVSRGFNTARFIGTVAILSGSGVPLVEGMRIASEVVSNLEIQARVREAAIRVSEGGSLNKALTDAGYFRPMMLHMIASGEASGELDNMLQRTADAEDQQVKELISTVLALFEPLMVVLMGGIVLIIVLSIVLPIMEMNTFVG
ncbi:type II secretion system inner membrane protein GspF [Saccharospirillum salsuginis]|uniref:Type II secretion system protein F n=1 Tax=Saccharospirillum salsuginis TaxID=418750 RepID=A0A918K6D8_9GAMM|nr:type II secretion system inner membrane protein GspF [Saccharospirillum salsuginis]GGX51989.1 type II secretion system protein F [Saccharospirillum salsuginis]